MALLGCSFLLMKVPQPADRTLPSPRSASRKEPSMIATMRRTNLTDGTPAVFSLPRVG